jgi:hypothetical protein
MAIENRSARRKLASASVAVAAIALMGIALAAPTAQASKSRTSSKSKPVLYRGEITATAHWRFPFGASGMTGCGDYEEVAYQYGATYYPKDLGDLGGNVVLYLLPKTRAGNGRLESENTHPSCFPPPGGSTPKSCLIGVETPPPGLYAGNEDGGYSEVKPGDPVPGHPEISSLVRGVKVSFAPHLTLQGSCGSGSISGWPGECSPDPSGFISGKAIGRKSITVHIAGACNAAGGAADLGATLTLTRIKAKKH